MADLTPTAAASFLGPALTAEYAPTLIYTQNVLFDQGKYFTLWDVERMRRDYRCQFGIRILRAPVFTATWEVKSKDQATIDFMDRQLRRFWQTSLIYALTNLEYGASGGEPTYRLTGENGQEQIEFDTLKPLHLFDVRPRERGGKLTGVTVRNVRGDGNETGGVRLRPPRAFYLVNEPDCNPFWGKSRYYSAWERWQEKTAQHGAIDCRRIWYLRNAFRGPRIRHPMGTIETAPGVFSTCQDYARQIVEWGETGNTVALPNSFNKDTGKYLWELEDPEIHGNLNDVRDYIKDLDREILEGMGIPEEVVKAQDTGSGYSGRAIPALMFYTSEDQIVQALIQAFQQWIGNPLQQVNGLADYEIVPTSLVPKAPEPQPSPGGVEKPATGGSPPAKPPPAGSVEAVRLDVSEPDRADTESASPVVDAILEKGMAAGLAISDEVRRKVRQAVKKKFGREQPPLT